MANVNPLGSFSRGDKSGRSWFRGVFSAPRCGLEQAQDFFPVRVRMDVKEDDKAYVVH
jgi:hypothetical protein